MKSIYEIQQFITEQHPGLKYSQMGSFIVQIITWILSPLWVPLLILLGPILIFVIYGHNIKSVRKFKKDLSECHDKPYITINNIKLKEKVDVTKLSEYKSVAKVLPSTVIAGFKNGKLYGTFLFDKKATVLFARLLRDLINKDITEKGQYKVTGKELDNMLSFMSKQFQVAAIHYSTVTDMMPWEGVPAALRASLQTYWDWDKLSGCTITNFAYLWYLAKGLKKYGVDEITLKVNYSIQM
jgi:hypothetical protein